MKQPVGRENPTFRQAFCRQFRCKPEDFERRLFARCLSSWMRWLVACWLAAKPDSFGRELALLTRLGEAKDVSPVLPELEGYAYENERDKPMRVAVFGIRLSRRRCLRIFRQVMGMPGTE